MKTISIFKRWVSMSLLFLGISLMAYADAPRVVLSDIYVSNVTSNSVDLGFLYMGATRVVVTISNTPVGGYYTICDEEIPSEYSNDYGRCYVRNLLPNTTYYIRVEVTGAPDPDDPDNLNLYNRESRFVTVTTESAPEL